MRKNIAANFAGRAWSAISVWVFTPFYLQYLGAEPYGLVALYGSLYAMASVFDFGMTATLTRELARLSAINAAPQKARNLVRTLESAFLLAAIFLLIGLVAASGPLASHWIKAPGLPQEAVQHAVSLMALAIVPQLLSGLYLGGMLGLEKQVQVNAVLIALGLLRGVGAIFVLRSFSNIDAYFEWQVGVNILQLALLGLLLWGSLPRANARARIDFAIARGVWRYSAGMAAMGITGAVLLNLDRLLLSRLLPLETVAYYSLAMTLANVPLIAVGPVNTAVLPALTQAAARRDQRTLSGIYHRASQLVSVLVFPVGFVIAMFAPQICSLWLRAPSAEHVYGLLSVLIFGPSLMALTCVPYSVQLAHGCTKIAVRVNVVAMLLLAPLLVFLAGRRGAMGACAVYVLLGVASLAAHAIFTHRRLLAREFRAWMLHDTLSPCAAAFAIAALARLLFRPASPMATLAYLILTWLAAAASSALAAGYLRTSLFRSIGEVVPLRRLSFHA